MGVVLREGLGQGGAAPDVGQDAARDGPEALGRRQLGLDGQRSIEGDPGLEQRRQPLGEGDEVAPGHPSGAQSGQRRAQRAAPGAPARGDPGRDLDGIVGIAPELLDGRAHVGRFHDAVDGAPPPVRGPIDERRHYVSSWVTRRISSTVVTPAQALAQPSSRSVTIPRSTAWRRIAAVGAFPRIRLRASSVSRKSS